MTRDPPREFPVSSVLKPRPMDSVREYYKPEGDNVLENLLTEFNYTKINIPDCKTLLEIMKRHGMRELFDHALKQYSSCFGQSSAKDSLDRQWKITPTLKIDQALDADIIRVYNILTWHTCKEIADRALNKCHLQYVNGILHKFPASASEVSETVITTGTQTEAPITETRQQLSLEDRRVIIQALEEKIATLSRICKLLQ